MKTWENWSIDCGDKDESKVVISGSATSLDRVYINFESGADAGNYIITYNDGIRCITKTYTVAGAPCEIEWLGDTECITCDCDCTKLALNEASVSIPIGGCSNMAIGSYSECISTITTEGESWANISATNGELILNVGSNADSSRSTTVTFTYGVSCDSSKSCTKTLSISQDGTGCGCGSITYSGTYEDDPTPVTEQFKVKIQIHNATNNTIYWDVIDFNFADGKEESPETCDSCQDNTTTVWHYGGSSSHDDWVSFVSYTSTDTVTLSSALINLTDSSCGQGAGVKTLTTTQTTWHNGDTILLQYNG